MGGNVTAALTLLESRSGSAQMSGTSRPCEDKKIDWEFRPAFYRVTVNGNWLFLVVVKVTVYGCPTVNWKNDPGIPP
jgi:hypothetical protein